MADLVLGVLVGAVFAALAAIVKICGDLHNLRRARLMLEGLVSSVGIETRLVRLLDDVASRRRRLGRVLVLIVVGVVSVGWVIWRLASS